jgi:ribosomal protein L37AE/L43A
MHVGLNCAEAQGGLYGRLLQRLAVALDGADSASRQTVEATHELELSGLSPAELQLVRAYLDQDMSWLQGWHAAAQELALLEQQSAKTAKSVRSSIRPLHRVPPRVNPLLKRRQQLCCALCGTAAIWPHGQGVPACSACGSQLFRAGSMQS